MALPHPSELACFEPRPGHSSKLAAMLSGSSRSSSGPEEGLGGGADKELQRTGAHPVSDLLRVFAPKKLFSWEGDQLNAQQL